MVAVVSDLKLTVLDGRRENRVVIDDVVVDRSVEQRPRELHVVVIIGCLLARRLARQETDDRIMHCHVDHVRPLAHQIARARDPVGERLVVTPVRLSPMRIGRGVFPGAGPGGIVQSVFVIQVGAKNVVGGKPTERLIRRAAPTAGVKGFGPDARSAVQTGDRCGNLGVVVVSPCDRSRAGVVETRSRKPALGAEVIDVTLALTVDILASPVVMTR